MFTVSLIVAQTENCIDDIKRCERLMDFQADSLFAEKNLYVNYVVKATNWEDETTVSNVQMHRKKDQLHFFSEQVSIYSDSKETVMVMPYQKVLMVSSIENQKANNKNIGDNFIELKKAFLESCEVVKCENITDGVKIIVLKNNPEKNDNSLLRITEMTYELNPKLGTVISVKINYTTDYKVKEITTTYKEYSEESSYDFLPVKSYISDRKGNLLTKFKDYEFIDNREEVASAKKNSQKK
ncbi:hypothetical protein CNR22_00115 [Sphingobacteriaceae bacterium]|nr:hypothetical protein CNR22_00115 [Sphingobacteriaceae bacterium]